MWFITTIEGQWQVAGDYLLTTDSRTCMALADKRMTLIARLTQHPRPDDTMADVRLYAKALDTWRIACHDANVMQHRRFLKKFLVKPQLWVCMGYLQTTVCHLPTVRQ